MDKIFKYLAMLEMLAQVLAASNDMPLVMYQVAVRDAAKKFIVASDDVRDELKNPDKLSRLWLYIKHHGNLPGTPESRGEKS